MTSVGDIISVVASFGPRMGIRPVRFRWRGRLIEVGEITYAWKTREGREELHHFSVSSESSLYELSFNTTSLVWRIEGVEDPV